MPFITRELIRKRSEHNEGIISTLEEISLHQEELESISPILGQSCKKLKIIYLQNNIISKMENLNYFKDLIYLNLALNNVTKIEGLQNCEFLNKLDLTLNFIDFDTFKHSIEHLSILYNLKELYMIGNPCQSNWSDTNETDGNVTDAGVKGDDKYRAYIISKLPLLKVLDGIEITRSAQILAKQRLPLLEVRCTL